MTGTSIEQLVAVNCLPESLMIIVGNTLFLPSQPSTLLPATTVPAQPSPTVFAPAATQDDDRGGGEDNSGPGGGGDG